MGIVLPFRRLRWVLPFRRLRWALARKRSTPRFAFLRHYFGFLALAALIIGASAFALWPTHDTGAPRAVAAAYVRVIDGDSLDVDGKKIRLTGIDAPELSQTCRDAQAREWSCGQAAKAYPSGIGRRVPICRHPGA